MAQCTYYGIEVQRRRVLNGYTLRNPRMAVTHIRPRWMCPQRPQERITPSLRSPRLEMATCAFRGWMPALQTAAWIDGMSIIGRQRMAVPPGPAKLISQHLLFYLSTSSLI